VKYSAKNSVVQFCGAAAELAAYRALVDSVSVNWQTSQGKVEAAQVLFVPEGKKIKVIAPSPLCTWVFAKKGWTTQRLAELKSLYPSAYFVELGSAVSDQAQVVVHALEAAVQNFEQQRLLTDMRTQNRKIEEINTNLENIVKERTKKESDSRLASKQTLERVRDLVRFVQDLTHSVDLSEILNLIRREIKTFHGTGDPILYLGQTQRLLHFRNSAVSVKFVAEPWPVSSRIRINSPEESQFLANQLSRPIAHVISFPLPVPRPEAGPDHSPVLFFEHNLSREAVDEFLTFIGERLQPVSLAIDRILLEQELKSASRVWEMTFDGLNEPIAILDMDNKLLRANSHFHAGLTPFLSTAGGAIRLGDHRYILEKYPIRLKSEGEALSWVAYFRDETRSMKLKSQMIQVEKMSAIGHLAGHIAHELNNPLTGIRSLAQILLQETEATAQVHSDLKEVEKAAQRCQSIINNLLEFSRGGLSHKTERLNLNELVERTLPLLKSVLGRLESEIDLADAPLVVKVEPHLMQQVIFNLVNNACQAIDGKGRVEVKTRKLGGAAVLEVRDSGHGIPEHLSEMIFEPFFTTKLEGEGTGLGLSLSRDFIRQFGGEIICESKPGEGAVFRVTLPLETSK
jgi:two-component system NtrC family sensor kinase